MEQGFECPAPGEMRKKFIKAKMDEFGNLMLYNEDRNETEAEDGI